MTNPPLVSIVMSTYNDEESLIESIKSILDQTFTDFELIVINDGSTNVKTAQIIEKYAKADSRIVPVTKENEGLSKALIEGCSLARGKYIARQDADDISYPNRLQFQFDKLESNPDAVFCVSGTRITAPEGETLDEIIPIADSIQLTHEINIHMRGVPSHGCCMFRKDAYKKSGGYQWQFYFAQDSDLWLRLISQGNAVSVTKLCYELRESTGSVSAINREAQKKFCNIAQQAFKKRQSNESEEHVLQEAARVRSDVLEKRKLKKGKRNTTLPYRLISAKLFKRGDKTAALKYTKKALSQSPLSVKLWIDFMRQKLK